jgi:hypothetical protein
MCLAKTGLVRVLFAFSDYKSDYSCQEVGGR